ncbi:cysteine dioxygenase [Herbaspirillum rhizosphaerae]|uniref:cysteine dioxygenase family protein n=1 Tax=Herbaspirillum rhizosphaerae TaxID=346179 RepID=UPI00067B26E2|nr:cysteine dioxygenase [Herbaspirillum rhizosphaerae]
MSNHQRLRQFITSFAALLDRESGEAGIIRAGSALLRELVAVDDWLPEAYAQPDPERYRQYLLHVDSAQRFSVVSFVWGPGQQTPVHDHTVWGLIGMLRGSEYSQSYRHQEGALLPHGEPIQLTPGMVEAVSPHVDGLDDIHRVRNAYDDKVSISIHVYGANIGAVHRSVYQPDGTRKAFISGYSNTTLPNIWDLSLETKTR